MDKVAEWAEQEDVNTADTRTTSENLDGMKNADWLRSRHPGTYKSIRNLPWVKDGLTQEESETAQDLLYSGVNDHETLDKVLDLQWTKDGITPQEAKTIKELMYLSHRDPDTTRKLAAMPFLESVTEADALLIHGLRSKWQRGGLSGYMKHPTVADGIADGAVVFAVAATTLESDAHAGRILDPGGATVETIQTATYRTPRLSISIVRAGDRPVTDSSQVVEEAVNYVEDAMNMPLPTNHVIVLLSSKGVFGDYAGTNYGQAIAYLRKGEDGSDWDREGFRRGMVHEVAHYFWNGNEDWIDEGVADTLEAGFANNAGLQPETQTTIGDRCSLNTLEELASAEPATADPQYLCNYDLGGKLFKDLQQEQGEGKFRKNLQDMHRLIQRLQDPNAKGGITQVRQAFGDQEAVIARHWDGSETKTASAMGNETDLTPTPAAVRAPQAKVHPTPHPRATAKPTRRQPTGSIRVVAAPTSPNQPMVTSATLAPTAASTPTPPPTATPTPVPTPTPTPLPTPTSTPPPTPEYLDYQNTDLGFSLKYPYGWTATTGPQGMEAAGPGGPGNQLSVQVEPFQKRWTIDDLLDHHREKTLPEIWTWEHYRETDLSGKYTEEGVNYVEIRFERQKTPADCMEDGVTHLFRSKFFPRKPSGFAVTMTFCAEEPGPLEEKRTTSMNSFREQ